MILDFTTYPLPDAITRLHNHNQTIFIIKSTWREHDKKTKTKKKSQYSYLETAINLSA